MCIDVISVGAGNNDVSSVGVGNNDVSSVGVDNNDVSSVGVGNIDVRSVEVGNSDVSSVGVGNNDVSSVGVGNNDISSVGVGNTDVSGVWVGNANPGGVCVRAMVLLDKGVLFRMVLTELDAVTEEHQFSNSSVRQECPLTFNGTVVAIRLLFSFSSFPVVSIAPNSKTPERSLTAQFLNSNKLEVKN